MCMSKDYRKKCSNCQTEIIMSDVTGKWTPLETDNTTVHRCISKKEKEDKPPSRPPMVEEKQQQQQPSVSVNTTYEISELKKKVSAMEAWIKKVSESAVMNL